MNLDEELRAASVKRMYMEDAKAALQAALEELEKAKKQAHEGHIQVGHASAALSRALLHVTGCSEGEFDTHMETAERILEQLKDDSKYRDELGAALKQATDELMAMTQERDGLAAALKKTKDQCYASICSVDEEQRRGGVFANPLLAVSARFALAIIDHKDPATLLAAHDRQVAARVLSREAREWAAAVDFKSHMHVAETCLEVAAEYESGEREVPNA